MTLALTGATSFLGRHILAAASQRGVSAMPLSRANANLGTTDGQKALALSLESCDAILHVAQPDNENHTISTLRTLTQSGRPVVFVSSVAVYGHQPFGRGIVETAPKHPITENGRLKKISEEFLQTHSDKNLILRLPQITGRGVEKYTPGVMREKLRRHDPITLYHNGQVALDFVDVADVAHSVLNLVTKNATGTYNMGSGEAFILLDFVEKLRQALNSRSIITLSPEKKGVDWAVMNNEHLKQTHGIHLVTNKHDMIQNLVCI